MRLFRVPPRVWFGVLFAGGMGTTLLCAGLVLTGPTIPDRVEPIFELERARTLAGRGGPSELRATEVVAGLQVHAFLTTGAPWELRKTPVFPVELRWADGSSVVVEAASDDICADDFVPAHSFDAAAYERMQQAMLRADHIVATHEHFDHLCGLARSPHLDVLIDKVRMPAGQLDGTAMMTVANDRLRREVQPVDLGSMIRLAPGVVLIPAPGHTAGSLWVYVREEEGAEWLFVGDSVWSLAAITELSPKPWLPMLVAGEDPAADARSVRFLHDLRRDHPELRVMVAHEGAQWEQALAEGALVPL